MPHPTHTSEFPNANFELHDGAIWITKELRGRAKLVVRPAPAPSAQPEPVAATADDFPRLVEAMVSVLLEAGATRAAAGIQLLLEHGEVDESTFGDVLVGGALVKQGSRIALTSGGLTTARAWRSLLGGASDDLSSCESTLDAWCAELLSNVSGKPVDDLRKALRRRGVAAFGLLAA
jgi:hypothetical protein